MLTVWGFVVAARLAPLLPPAWAYALATVAGRCAYALAPRARANVEANLRHVLGPGAPAACLQRAVRSVFVAAARNYAGLFLPPADPAEALARCTLTGWEHLEAALARGRGVVLLTGHFGGFNFYADIFHARRIPVTVLVERLRPPRLFHLVNRLRNRRGVRFVEAEGSGGEAMRALRRNEVVAIAADRLVVGRGCRLRFFDAWTELPIAPVVLARRCRSALIPAFGYDEPGRTVGWIGPPLDLGDLDGQGWLPAAMQRVADALEQAIRRRPDQWIVLQRVWPDGSDECRGPGARPVMARSLWSGQHAHGPRESSS